MAAFILAIAGGLSIWGRLQQGGQITEIRQAVRDLVMDVRSGRDPALLAASDPTLKRNLAEALPGIIGSDAIDIEVVAGDLKSDATLLQAATHVATLRRRGEVLVRLRLVHRDQPGGTAIIGFWRPPPE